MPKLNESGPFFSGAACPACGARLGAVEVFPLSGGGASATYVCDGERPHAWGSLIQGAGGEQPRAKLEPLAGHAVTPELYEETADRLIRADPDGAARIVRYMSARYVIRNG